MASGQQYVMPHQHPEAARLPHYDNPPVVETILGVQFDRLRGFRNAHLGAFWQTLDTREWPVVADAPLLNEQFERFSEETRWASGAQLRLTQDPSCRLQIKGADGDRMIQVQHNRLHFNWLGEAGGRYRRYEWVRSTFSQILNQFKEFVDDAKVGELRPNQWEITYLNHIPKDTLWNSPADWNLFRPLAPMPTIEGLIEAESFSGEWHFVIPGQLGRLHVQWQHALREPRQNKEEIVRLTLTARGPVQGEGDPVEAVLEGLDLGRRTIVHSFEQLMGDHANQYWGRKDARD